MAMNEIVEMLLELTSAEENSVKNVADVLHEKCRSVRRNHEEYFAKVEASTSSETNSKSNQNSYISTLILLLREFVEEANRTRKELISVRELNGVLRGVEFLIAVGVRPCLASTSSATVATSTNTVDALRSSTCSSSSKPTNFEEETLDVCLTCLNLLCDSNLVQASIVSKYLGFILAGSLQLAYSPNSTKKDAHRRILAHQLVKIYRPFLFREFMLVQRSASSPKCIKTASAEYLSQMLVDVNGVSYFLRTTKDLGGNFDDYRFCGSVVSLLVTPPKSFAQRRKDYFENVFGQIWQCFRSYRNMKCLDEDFGVFFVVAAQKMLDVDAETFERFVLKGMHLPLTKLQFGTKEDWPTDVELTEAVEVIEYFYCTGPSDLRMVRTLFDSLPAFLTIFKDLLDSISFCLAKVRNIVSAILKAIESDEVVDVLRFWMGEKDPWRFSVSATGGVAVCEDSTENSQLDGKVASMVKVLNLVSEDKRPKIVSEFLLVGLRRMSVMDADLAYVDQPVQSTNFGEIDEKVRLIEGNVINLNLTATLIENFAEDMCKVDAEKIFELCEVVFENSFVSNEDLPEELRDQTLTTCFGIISALLLSSLTNNESETMKILLPKISDRLQLLAQNHPNENFRETAKVLLSSFNCPPNQSNPTSATNSDENITKKQQKNSWNRKELSYEEALRDMNDVLIPVRAHGLISMANLLRRKNPTALANTESLLQLFLDNAKNEDSYVFLPAINAIATVGELRTTLALDILLKKFLEFNANGEETATENQLKIGEAVVKISRCLGDVAPNYADQLINTFLGLLKTQNDDVRASCLSNIGEICALASYKITDCLHEIVYAVEKILRHDQSSLVRRSAVHLIRNVLIGADVKMLEVLKEEMLNIYRLMKKLYTEDSDDVVRLHAQLCLESIEANLHSAIATENSTNARTIRF